MDGYFPAPRWLLLACGCVRHTELRIMGFWMQVVAVSVLTLYPILDVWLPGKALYYGFFVGGIFFSMIASVVHHRRHQRRYQRRRAMRKQRNQRA